MTSPPSPDALTIDSIVDWVGDAALVTRGRRYADHTMVRGLVWASEDRRLIASIKAHKDDTEPHIATVEVDDEGHPGASSCSCSDARGAICAHAVGVVLRAAHLIARGQPIRPAARGDVRRVVLRDARGDLPPQVAALKGVLQSVPKNALVTLIMDLADRFPEVYTRLAMPPSALGEGDDVAWRAARDFFASPSAPRFEALRAQCERLDVWPAVSPWVSHFLWTGRRLDADSFNFPAWPLRPVTIEPPEGATFPSQVFFDILLQSGDLLDALGRTTLQTPSRHTLNALAHALADSDLLDTPDPDLRFVLGVSDATLEDLAEALTETRPAASVRLWEALVDAHIRRGNSRSYDAACEALQRSRRAWVAHHGRGAWIKRVEGLRATHRRKRSLIARLDVLLDGERR